MRSIHTVLFLAFFCSFSEAARILAVFPFPSISHQVVFRPLTRELARRGHEVVVITTDPAYPKGEAPENLTEIDFHDLSYKIWRDSILKSKTTSKSSDDLITPMRTIIPLVSKIFELQMMTEQVQQIINNRTNHFDLILAEACVRPALSVSHVLKAPVVLVSSFGGMMRNYDVVGAPMRPPLLYPTNFRQRIYNLSLWEKVMEFYNYYLFEQLFSYCEMEDNKMLKRLYGPDTPTISELENNVHMMMLNSYPIWESNRPVPPNVVYLGGIHQNPSKELPKELQSYLDSSKHGVIYISFGTNVDPAALPPERIQVLVRAFSKLPYDVLWKWSKDELPGRTPNIRISKWLPQSDLLKHPKIKLFITQGGLQSTDEALTAGVPLIGMPMLGDQPYNVEQYVYHKIGLRMDLQGLTEETLINGINTIINDDSYRKNVVRLRNIMRAQPQPPIERAMFWFEHILTHGGATHLRAKAANMSWWEYLDVELLAVLSLAVLTVLTIICVTLYKLASIAHRYLFAGNKLKAS